MSVRAVVRGRARDCESEFRWRWVYASFQANSRAATPTGWQPSVRKLKSGMHGMNFNTRKFFSTTRFALLAACALALARLHNRRHRPYGGRCAQGGNCPRAQDGNAQDPGGQAV